MLSGILRTLSLLPSLIIVLLSSLLFFYFNIDISDAISIHITSFIGNQYSLIIIGICYAMT